MRLILAAVLNMLDNYVGSLARAMLTFCVAKEEVGKIFSFLAFVDGVLPALCQLMYAEIWTVKWRYCYIIIYFMNN